MNERVMKFKIPRLVRLMAEFKRLAGFQYPITELLSHPTEEEQERAVEAALNRLKALRESSTTPAATKASKKPSSGRGATSSRGK